MTNWTEYNKRLVDEDVDAFVSKDLMVDQKQLERTSRNKLTDHFILTL